MRKAFEIGFTSLKTGELVAEHDKGSRIESIIGEGFLLNPRRTYTHIRSDSVSNFRSFIISRIIQKQGNYGPYKLKQRNVENRIQAKPKNRKSWRRLGRPCFNIYNQVEYSWKKSYVVYLVGSTGVVYYELLKWNEAITEALNRIQLMKVMADSRKMWKSSGRFCLHEDAP